MVKKHIIGCKKIESEQATFLKKEARELFEGLSFKYPPVPKEDYIRAYEEYVRRCCS